MESGAIVNRRRLGRRSSSKRSQGNLVPMRLWHLFVFILALSLILAIVRDPVGRIALIVFVTALGEVVIGDHGGPGSVPDHRLARGSQGAVRARGGRRHDRAGLDHRDDHHVVVAVRGSVAGPGVVPMTG